MHKSFNHSDELGGMHIAHATVLKTSVYSINFEINFKSTLKLSQLNSKILK